MLVLFPCQPVTAKVAEMQQPVFTSAAGFQGCPCDKTLLHLQSPHAFLLCEVYLDLSGAIQGLQFLLCPISASAPWSMWGSLCPGKSQSFLLNMNLQPPAQVSEFVVQSKSQFVSCACKNVGCGILSHSETARNTLCIAHWQQQAALAQVGTHPGAIVDAISRRHLAVFTVSGMLSLSSAKEEARCKKWKCIWVL